MQRTILGVVLVGFLGLSGMALVEHGYWGIIEPLLVSYGGLQVFVDLVIALGLFLVWMWKHATAAGRNPWPWLVFTLMTGSIAPLICLLIYGVEKETSTSI